MKIITYNIGYVENKLFKMHFELQFLCIKSEIYRQEMPKQNLFPKHKQTYSHQIIQFDIKGVPRKMTVKHFKNITH